MSDQVSPEIVNRVSETHERGKQLVHQDPLDAIRVYDEAIAIAHNDPGLTAWVRFDKGKTLSGLGRYEEALTELQQSKDALGENTWVYAEIGNAHVGMKQFSTALAEYNQAIALNPENWEAAQGKERIALLKQQAEQFHSEGVQKLSQGDRSGALQAYEHAIDLVGVDNAPWSVFDLGKTLESMGRYDEAVVQLTRAKELLPSVIWPDVEIANVFIAQKDFSKAETYLAQTEQSYPGNAAVKERVEHIAQIRQEAEQLHRDGVRLRSEHNYQEAENNYRRAIQLVGEQNAVWSVFDLGITLRELGKTDESLITLQRSKELLPGTIWPDIEIGKVYIEQKALTIAQAYLEELGNAHPESVEIKESLARIRKLRDDAEYFHIQGVRFRNDKNYSAAEEQYRLAIERVGEDNAPWSVFDLGVTYRLEGKITESVEMLLRARKALPPNTIWVEIQLGESLVAANDIPQAINAYNRALQIDPDSRELKQKILSLGGEIAGAVQDNYPNLPLDRFDPFYEIYEQVLHELTEEELSHFIGEPQYEDILAHPEWIQPEHYHAIHDEAVRILEAAGVALPQDPEQLGFEVFRLWTDRMHYEAAQNNLPPTQEQQVFSEQFQIEHEMLEKCVSFFEKYEELCAERRIDHKVTFAEVIADPDFFTADEKLDLLRTIIPLMRKQNFDISLRKDAMDLPIEVFMYKALKSRLKSFDRLRHKPSLKTFWKSLFTLEVKEDNSVMKKKGPEKYTEQEWDQAYILMQGILTNLDNGTGNLILDVLAIMTPPATPAIRPSEIAERSAEFVTKWKGKEQSTPLFADIYSFIADGEFLTNNKEYVDQQLAQGRTHADVIDDYLKSSIFRRTLEAYHQRTNPNEYLSAAQAILPEDQAIHIAQVMRENRERDGLRIQELVIGRRDDQLLSYFVESSMPLYTYFDRLMHDAKHHAWLQEQRELAKQYQQINAKPIDQTDYDFYASYLKDGRSIREVIQIMREHKQELPKTEFQTKVSQAHQEIGALYQILSDTKDLSTVEQIRRIRQVQDYISGRKSLKQIKAEMCRIYLTTDQYIGRQPILYSSEQPAGDLSPLVQRAIEKVTMISDLIGLDKTYTNVNTLFMYYGQFKAEHSKEINRKLFHVFMDRPYDPAIDGQFDLTRSPKENLTVLAA